METRVSVAYRVVVYVHICYNSGNIVYVKLLVRIPFLLEQFIIEYTIMI
jgi:hypothetical protein